MNHNADRLGIPRESASTRIGIRRGYHPHSSFWALGDPTLRTVIPGVRRARTPQVFGCEACDPVSTAARADAVSRWTPAFAGVTAKKCGLRRARRPFARHSMVASSPTMESTVPRTRNHGSAGRALGASEDDGRNDGHRPHSAAANTRPKRKRPPEGGLAARVKAKPQRE